MTDLKLGLMIAAFTWVLTIIAAAFGVIVESFRRRRDEKEQRLAILWELHHELAMNHGISETTFGSNAPPIRLRRDAFGTARPHFNSVPNELRQVIATAEFAIDLYNAHAETTLRFRSSAFADDPRAASLKTVREAEHNLGISHEPLMQQTYSAMHAASLALFLYLSKERDPGPSRQFVAELWLRARRYLARLRLKR